MGLWKALKWSALGHVGIFLAFTIQSVFFASEPLIFQSAVRVDLVALPDKITPDEPPAPPAPKTQEPKEEPPKKEPVVKKEPQKPKPKVVQKQDTDAIKLDKTKQKSALNKLKQLSAFERLQERLAEQKRKEAEAAAKKAQAFKGNEISEGTALSGVGKLQHDAYLSEIDRHFRNNWSLPEYLRNRGLIAEVVVRLDRVGNIIGSQLVKSSGNPTFDDIVMSAVQKSSPVPPPPDKFVRISELQGFLFRFSE